MIAAVLACLACAGHGSRWQLSTEWLQDSSCTESRCSQKRKTATPTFQSWLELKRLTSSRRLRAIDPLREFTILLFSFNNAAAAPASQYHAKRTGGGRFEETSKSPFLALEHVNLNVPMWTPELDKFWFGALGCANDTRTDAVFHRTASSGGTMKGLVWANIGLQQIHMPIGEAEETTQRVRGSVGLAFRDLPVLRKRLREFGVDFLEDDDAQMVEWFGEAVNLETPTGVRLRIHSSSKAFGPPEAIEAGISLPGGHSLGTGLPYLELRCPPGTASALARFYREVLGVPAEFADAACLVPIGNQKLLYREIDEELPEYDGHHLAVYVGDISRGDTVDSFIRMYKSCQAAGIIFNNPRFPELRYDALDDALRLGEFRFLNLIDPDSGKILYKLEHEIRSLTHHGFSGRELLQ